MQYPSQVIKGILSKYSGITNSNQYFDQINDRPFSLLNQSFLKALVEGHESFEEIIKKFDGQDEYQSMIEFYKVGLLRIHQELDEAINKNSQFQNDLSEVSGWFQLDTENNEIADLAEQTWKIFFPEGSGIFSDPEKSINELRKKRAVKITKLNDHPIISPLDEMIFTSNALLTIPAKTKNIKDLGFSERVKDILSQTVQDKQLYWYDHPIQIGVEPEKNEVLYGMRALNKAVAFEKQHRHAPADKKLTCILSASVTHERLHQIAKEYLEDEFHRDKNLEHINLYLFTETETDLLIDEILVPAAIKYLDKSRDEVKALLQVFGVDGEYGRHYSFLKAVTAFWQVFIDPSKKATFKIDLDQVFPQEVLLEESGLSAFEHLRTPLWGAEGVDSEGEAVDLGMIAGALVNEKDIHKSLFTADVPIPEKVETADELIFFSKLPQAVSTQAEMLTRYHSSEYDGKSTCIQRVHVTGGTNGILIDRLFRYRPFTPSFFGRAEDQAYIMSILDRDETDLAYVHEPGLIMRHDKEAFAQEAMEAAKIGKLVGDYTRILLFSAYSNLLNAENFRIKNWLDPFTGCFISKIPVTVVYLRFALKAMQFFIDGKDKEGIEFIKNGVRRISETLRLLDTYFESEYRDERAGWELYYDILTACRSALEKNDPFAIDLEKKAEEIINNTHLNI
jgi:hypothetical protein